MIRRKLQAAALGLTLAATLASLAACSFLSHRVTWSKSGVSEDQAQSDLAACTEEAKTQTDRDTSIDQDIAAADTASSPVDTTPLQNMQAYQRDRRFKSVLEDCMGQLGYRKVE
jgi:hypothetical protein